MAVRIVNDLMPDEEGIVFDTAAEAETALAYMIVDYKRRGFTVTETDDNVDCKRWCFVVDEARRPFGVYYIEFE